MMIMKEKEGEEQGELQVWLERGIITWTSRIRLVWWRPFSNHGRNPL